MERTVKYHFQYIGGSPNVRWNDPRWDALYLEEADIVGIESPKHKLIGWLLGGFSHCTMVLVVGMRGLGKTTLAIKFYDYQTVRRKFDCHA
jgi:disease resistance protein RPM1